MAQSVELSSLVDEFPFLNTELPDGNPLYVWIDAFPIEADAVRTIREDIADMLVRDLEELKCSAEASAWAARLAESVDDIPYWVVSAYDTMTRSYEELRWALVKVYPPLLRSISTSWWPENATEVVTKVVEETLTKWKTTPPGTIDQEIQRWRSSPSGAARRHGTPQ